LVPPGPTSALPKKKELRYFLAFLFEIEGLQIKIIQALIFAVKRVLDTGLAH
jgi:hypothetical protein